MITRFKIFENIEIKKYMVVNMGRYYIDEFINIEKGTVYFKNVFHYTKQSNKKIKNDKINEVESAESSTYLGSIQFSSDNLLECEKYIELNIDSEKYNL